MATRVERLAPGMIVQFDDAPTPMTVEAIEDFEGYIIVWLNVPPTQHNGWWAHVDMRILSPGELVG